MINLRRLLSSRPQWVKRQAEKRPWMLSTRSSKWFITVMVAVAVFTDIFLYAVVVPVIPFAITERAGIPSYRIQYWVTVLIGIYAAANLAASPFTGWFADHSSSRRLPLMIGLLALTGATAMLNVGDSIGVLMAGRALQGVSAAIVWTVGLALLVDTVGTEQIGQYMGYVGLSMSLGILVAPLLGGVVFDKGGYNAVFAMQYGLIGIDVIFRLLLVEKKIARKWIETPDAVASGTIQEKSPATTGTGQGPEDPTRKSKEHPPAAVEPSPTSPTLSSARQRWQRLPPVVTLLSSRRLLNGLWGILVVAALMTSFDSTLPNFVRHTFNWNSVGAGLIFLPIVVPSFLGPLVGWISDRYGPRYLGTIGFIMACPVLVLLRLVDHNSIGQKVLLCTLLALFGVSVSLVFPPIMAEISIVVEAKERSALRAGLPSPFGKGGAYAQAYALFNVAWAGGALVGPVWAGFVYESSGWGTVGWSLGLLSILSAIPTFIWAGGSIRKKYRRARSDSDGAVVV